MHTCASTTAHLQTPVHLYTHTGTGRRVTLVATMHVGEPAYYAGLREVIADAETAGAVVQAEGSRQLPNAADITADEQALLNDLGRRHGLEQTRVPLLGWTTQLDGLGYPPHWQIHDLSELDIIRLVGVPVIGPKVRRMVRMLDWPADDPAAVNRFRFASTIALRRSASPAHQRRRPDPGDEIIIDRRNTVALAGLATTNRDVVLIWGTGHIPGLDAGLLSTGFARTRTRTDWHTVADLPRIGAAVRRLLRGHRQPPHGEPAADLEPAASTDPT